MKTAIQELIDEINLIESYPMNPLIIKIATDLLEKEKEQIADAFELGYTDAIADYEKFGSGKEYYNKTYGKDQ